MASVAWTCLFAFLVHQLYVSTCSSVVHRTPREAPLFIGKRGPLFIGKRQPRFIGKRGPLFIGKRGPRFIGKRFDNDISAQISCGKTADCPKDWCCSGKGPVGTCTPPGAGGDLCLVTPAHHYSRPRVAVCGCELSYKCEPLPFSSELGMCQRPSAESTSPDWDLFK